MPENINFSGIVSLLFAIIEFALFVNVLIFAERNSLNRKAAALILLLFGYQLFEFLICNTGLNSTGWIYIALIDITFLPPLGLVIILELAGKKNKFSNLLYLPALFFSVYYLMNQSGLELTLCTIFAAGYSYPLSFTYGVFYYAPLTAGFYFLIKLVSISEDPKLKKLAGLLLAGYTLSFIPPLIFSILLPDVMLIIESFLCKFAIFLAIASAFFAISNKQIKNQSEK